MRLFYYIHLANGKIFSSLRELNSKLLDCELSTITSRTGCANPCCEEHDYELEEFPLLELFVSSASEAVSLDKFCKIIIDSLRFIIIRLIILI